MTSIKYIEDELKIPRKCIAPVTKNRSICLVPDIWLKAVCGQRPQLPDTNQYFNLPDNESPLLLVPSNNKLPASWRKISIKMICKIEQVVQSKVNQPFASQKGVESLAELMRYLELDIYKGLWRQANRKYGSANTYSGAVRSRPVYATCSDLIKDTLGKIFNCPVNKINIVSRDGSSAKLSKVPSSSQLKAGAYSRSASYLENARSEVQLLGYSHCNVQPAYAILESDTAFYVIQPYSQYKLDDIVTFSPALLDTCYAKTQFILYQLLQGIRQCHRQGISVGDISLQKILTDDKLWVTLIQPTTKKICEQPKPATQEKQARDKPGKKVEFNFSKYGSYRIEELPKLTHSWVKGEMSNFDYLMVLNYLSGRRINDPNHHPVLPWVMDFTSPNGNYRDLTKSKFRLNKGDRQLDLTYDISVFSNPLHDTSREGDNAHVAHHISDVLSDITYYVYKARRTPKPVLCAHVRSNWVPHEYPSSMQRMQEWTPDECIPEFFTDPTIFTSIHEDLPDLEIPSWAQGVEDFIYRHMAVLEGQQVSHRLHHWIDLTFGFKLSGVASVKAKNVCLQLVDDHTDLRNHGVVQLFTQPHPVRHMPSPYNTSFPPSITRQPEHIYQLPERNSERESGKKDQGLDKRPKTEGGVRAEEALITLPISYDPVAMLDHLETQFNFSVRAAHASASSQTSSEPPAEQNWLRENIHRDMQAFGCVVAEMFLSPKLRVIDSSTSLEQRYQLIRTVCSKSMEDIPRPVRQVIRYLLQLHKPWPQESGPTNTGKQGQQHNQNNTTNNVDVSGELVKALFKYDAISAEGLPPPCPDLLCHPGSSLFPFPPYFPSLHALLDDLHRIQWNMNNLQLQPVDIPPLERTQLLRTLAKDRVNLLSKYLNKMIYKLGPEGLDLVIPYVIELFDDQWSSVHAAWLLFNPIATALGPRETNKKLLSHLIDLLNSETTTVKHIKLYHRSFIMQVAVRVGMDAFLNQFSTLLVEAAAGYRNFLCEEGVDHQLSVEPEEAVLFDTSNLETMFDGELETAEGAIEAAEVDENGSSREIMLSAGIQEEASSSGPEEEMVFPDDVSLSGRAVTRIGAEQNVDNQSLCSLDPTAGDDDVISIGSAALDEEMYGQSVGRISVHSVSRLMSDDTDPAKQSPDQTDDNSPSGSDSISRSEDFKQMAPQSTFTRNETRLKSSTSEAPGLEYNISDVSSETIKWLSHRLGPVLTAKYLSRNLLRMLALCYYGDEQLEPDTTGPVDVLSTTGKCVMGDRSARHILDCLVCIAVSYGESVIMLQYFAYARELISNAEKRLTTRAEAGLIACVVLLKHILPYLSDATLLDNLQEVIFKDLIIPVLRLVSSTNVSYPSGSRIRTAICHKLIDTLYMISLRIGFEMTREHMTCVLQQFFAAFNRVYDDNICQVKPAVESSSGSPTKQASLPEPTANGEMLFEVKLDAETKQYKIGTDLKVGSPPVRGHRRTPSGSIKLTLNTDETGEASENEPAADMEKDADTIMVELKRTFTAELAHLAYIPFCKLAGGIHMEQNLVNDDLIRQLCAMHDEALSKKQLEGYSNNALSNDKMAETVDSDRSQTTWFTSLDQRTRSPTESTVVSGNFGKNVSMAGNRITIAQESNSHAGTSQTDGGFLSTEGDINAARRKSAESAIDFDKLKSPEMDLNKQRHLKGNWLAYWEYELGLSERETSFNFKQIKLQTFSGHTASVRSICVLDNENSFISASKDKTVKLWSLRSFGDGMGRVGFQWSYPHHKKSVFAVTFLESLRLAASCDSVVHLWDPFVGMSVRQYESAKNAPVTVLTSVPAPSTLLVTATTDSMLRFLDVRKSTYTHDFKCSTSPAGLIRCVTTSPDGTWVAVGYSSGVISVVDTRTGLLLASWKGHEGELLQIHAFNKKTIVTSSFDQCVSVWNVDEAKIASQLKGIQEPVHCMGFYKGELVSATTANRVGVHTSLDRQASFSSTKLRSDVFRGVVTNLKVLPLNKLLLLGADNGSIKLLA